MTILTAGYAGPEDNPLDAASTAHPKTNDAQQLVIQNRMADRIIHGVLPRPQEWPSLQNLREFRFPVGCNDNNYPCRRLVAPGQI
jgi:hypothetical protein